MDKPPLPSPHDSPCQNSEACLRPELAQEGVSVSQGSGFKQLGQQEIDAYVRGEGGNRCFLNSKSIDAGGGRGWEGGEGGTQCFRILE